MDRQFMRLQRMLMWAYQEARMLDEAIREAQSTPEGEGPEVIFPFVVGCAYAAAGQQRAALQEEALQMVEKLLALTDQFSPALVQARASAPGLATKTARSSFWKSSRRKG